MADPKGFLKYTREEAPRRPVEERIRDWREIELHVEPAWLRRQASRCMDCGVPFCHSGCPLGNLIPDWNYLAYRNRWREALDRLHATNNFPELTGRLCPAPCEPSCVLAINQPAVSIKQIEHYIIDHGFERGWIAPEPPARRTGHTVGIVGSGPAGLAAAQQLNRAGHRVTVYERCDRIGGLLRYGIPDFKLEKWVLDRRLNLMEEEGVEFRPGVDAGRDISAERLRARHDAVVLAGGSTVARDLPVPGRELDGVHLAMDYLTQQNRVNAGDNIAGRRISAAGKHVVVLGGGDTGADCVGTAHRQGAASVRQLELLPRPPKERTESMPWPTWPYILRTSSAHEEGGERAWSVNTTEFVGECGRLTGLRTVRVAFGEAGPDGRRPMATVPGSEELVRADLVLLALGFVRPQREGLLDALGVECDDRGNVAARDYATSVPGVFAAGDMRRGQSLIVWAITEGRECARAVDAFVAGRSLLPLAGARLR
ncbi:MAG TPA: glutamate synthase subunit beta [Chthonomonadales bacterium]|nr:glutamate synthase subunit beta [Chthonomonadales bacterium]